MTPTEINAYLATKLMGGKYYDKPVAMYFYKDEYLPAFEWRPTEDRNQLALCLETIERRYLICEVVCELLPKVNPNREPEDSISQLDVWKCLTAPPELVCEAIVEAMEERKCSST